MLHILEPNSGVFLAAKSLARHAASQPLRWVRPWLVLLGLCVCGCSSGEGGGGGEGGAGGVPSGGAGGASTANLDPFSFFVTSLAAMQRLSGSSDGFGGDLRYGEADGLTGADKICREIAETSMSGSSAKVWRAFLSTTSGGVNNGPVNAADRIGQGPWYDRLGRLVAENLDNLINTRPLGADAAIIDDLPNEDGVPNHQPDPSQPQVDNHDILTGTNAQGQLYANDPGSTCSDWTSSVASAGTPRCGHSWPTQAGGGGGRLQLIGGGSDMSNWMSALDEAGCAPGVNLAETGGPNPSNPTVGSGGGYGAIYCFALAP